MRVHSNSHPLEHDSKVSVIGKAGNLKARTDAIVNECDGNDFLKTLSDDTFQGNNEQLVFLFPHRVFHTNPFTGKYVSEPDHSTDRFRY